MIDKSRDERDAIDLLKSCIGKKLVKVYVTGSGCLEFFFENKKSVSFSDGYAWYTDEEDHWSAGLYNEQILE